VSSHTAPSFLTSPYLSEYFPYSCIWLYIRYACPLCSKSVCDMSKVWEKLDMEIAATPMPEPYQNKMVSSFFPLYDHYLYYILVSLMSYCCFGGWTAIDESVVVIVWFCLLLHYASRGRHLWFVLLASKIQGTNHITLNMQVWILCNDCGQTSHVRFHFVAQKCLNCKSYNTRQTRGWTSSFMHLFNNEMKAFISFHLIYFEGNDIQCFPLLATNTGGNYNSLDTKESWFFILILCRRVGSGLGWGE
jgi:hypothetical protein